jgi:hypothetical protein
MDVVGAEDVVLVMLMEGLDGSEEEESWAIGIEGFGGVDCEAGVESSAPS